MTLGITNSGKSLMPVHMDIRPKTRLNMGDLKPPWTEHGTRAVFCNMGHPLYVAVLSILFVWHLSTCISNGQILLKQCHFFWTLPAVTCSFPTCLLLLHLYPWFDVPFPGIHRFFLFVTGHKTTSQSGCLWDMLHVIFLTPIETTLGIKRPKIPSEQL